MLKQTEGSHAVAEAVALCRPEVICAYPISPQTHIVEGLGEMVKSGALTPCEFINVESEFAAMCVAIGASAAGARTYTATASQGLLFMAEAVYNAVGPRPADRDDGRQPRDRRADQHLERPQRLDEPARQRLDPAVRRDQPGSARPAHPGVPARRGAVAAGHGVHGRLHPHPRLRARRHADAGEVDAFLPPYEPRQVLDPAEPVSIGAMVGPEAFMEVRYLAHAKQLSGARAASRASPRSSRRASAASRAAWCAATAARTPRRSSSRSARCSARSRTRSTSCATTASRSACSASTSFRPFPLAAVRAALQARAARRRAREEPRGRHRRRRLDRRAHVARRACSSHGYTVVAGPRRPRHHARRRCSGCSTSAIADRARAADLPRPRLRARQSRARARARRSAAPGRSPRASCATSAPSPRSR